ncbi:MAG: hypothetical protein H0W97_07730 [Actinobacteria bacterium]|nr:hypothetical protein [Actinomycetota bacterium]
MAVFGSSGRHANPMCGYFIGLILGLVGLSYPLLTWLNILSGLLQPGFLE